MQINRVVVWLDHSEAHIIAFDRDEMQLDLALRAGAIDAATADFAEIANVDVIFICVPVAQASIVFAALKPYLRVTPQPNK